MDAQDTRTRIKDLCQLVFTGLTVPWTETTTTAQLCSLCSDCDDDRIKACLIANWAFAAPDRDQCVTRAAEVKSKIKAGEIRFADLHVRNELLMPLWLFAEYVDVDESHLLRRLQFSEQEEAEVESRGEQAVLPLVHELYENLKQYYDALTGNNIGHAVPATSATSGEHTVLASQGDEQSAPLVNDSVYQSDIDNDAGAPGATMPEQQPFMTDSPAPAPTSALRKRVPIIPTASEFTSRKRSAPDQARFGRFNK